MTSPISVIIPVYNEVRTLSSIIEIVRSWGHAGQIIVVNDGSSDKTLESIAHFGKSIQIISYKKNVGKAHAMVAGINASKCEYVLFLDGDLVGLTHKDLDSLIAPVVSGKADMTIGARWTHRSGNQHIFKSIGGERAFKRKSLLPILDKIKHLGYGVELYFNNHFPKKRIVYVDMPYVSILVKFEKQSIPEGTITYIREAIELITQITKQQTGTVTPRVRWAYRTTLGYLKKILDYLQEQL